MRTEAQRPQDTWEVWNHETLLGATEYMEKETIADTKTKLEKMEQDYQFARLEYILEGLSNLHNMGAFCADHCKIVNHQRWEQTLTSEEIIWFKTSDGTSYKISIDKPKS